LIKIQKITLKDGSVRWRARGVSTGKDPTSGRRAQRTITGKTRKEVEAEVRRIGHAVDKGTYVKPWDGTLNELLGSYLRAATRGKEANTKLSYENALRIPREHLGRRRAMSITRDDIENMVDFAFGQGRVRGGKPGTGLGERSVRLMLQQLSAAFEQGINDRRLTFNPCRRVKADDPQVNGKPRRKRTSWNENQLQAFLAVADADRLAPVWRLLAYGLRRGETAGLAWDGEVEIPGGDTHKAVDLDGRTVTVGPTRVMVGGHAVAKDTPKSGNSWRTLPLTGKLTGQLQALRDLQQIEAIDAGTAYEGGRHVASDELGRPVSPEWLSDEFHRLAASAGVPRIRLHDTRATMNTILENAGVSDNFRAAWFGHGVEVNRSAYLRKPGDLTAVSDTLSPIFGPRVSKV
jgi:integrase